MALTKLDANTIFPQELMSTNQPTIAIFPLPDVDPQKPLHVWTSEPLMKSVQKAGGFPISLPPSAPNASSGYAQHKDFLLRCQGVVFPGGADITPHLYRKKKGPNAKSVESRFDRLQIDLAKFCIEKNIPVLGICRGQQVLNVAAGGSLIQDLVTERNTLIHDPQLRQSADWVEANHPIKIDPNSQLFDVIQRKTITVNSIHHQAVDRPGNGIVVTGKAPDGVIEAVEIPDKRFIIGMQSHPETMGRRFGNWAGKLFERFVARAKKAQGLPDPNRGTKNPMVGKWQTLPGGKLRKTY